MPQYIITYFGGNRPSSPEEGGRYMSKFGAWVASLNHAAVSPVNPLKNTCTVNSDSSVVSASASAMSAYTIIEVDSLETAVAMAKDCPHLELGGKLEVSELVDMTKA